VTVPLVHQPGAGAGGRVLVLAAEDDELYGAMQEPLRSHYPRAEVVAFPGGHAATAGRETDYLAAVRAFLAGQPVRAA
jgi:hypothetical protein